ncbi:MAG TPA: HlyD family secretion protein [Acidocella sp.]|jgi:membrane fusion protein (multidrug efflux system)|nr:HlyD family secretion protein [Acidocella sp.]
MAKHASLIEAENEASSATQDHHLAGDLLAEAERPRMPVTDRGSAPFEDTKQTTNAKPAGRSGRGLRMLLLAGAAVVSLGAAGDYGENYWTTGRFEVSTDDAYVKADNSAIAPKISGYVSQVLVDDNENVKPGQILARIDDRDLTIALAQAKADVAAARANVAGRQAALDVQQSVIDTARADLVADRANQAFAEQEDQRYAALAVTGAGTRRNAEQAAAEITEARAKVVRDQASLITAEKQVALLGANLSQAKATLAHDMAVEDQAETNLSYATITAPITGTVGDRTVRVGQYVQAGTQLMTLVPLSRTYVVANYKETQLTNVHPGQPVKISVDSFPGAIVHGHVQSIAPASGQEFALLPPDNATGNFTKVVQRIPVKISLDANDVFAGELRPGMSVEPAIDTRNADQSRHTAAD